MVSHECLECGQPAAIEPVWRTERDGKRWVRGYIHTECAQIKREIAARARKAAKWEEAGQQRLLEVE